MSKWFLIVITLIILSSIFAIVARYENREDKKRIENGELSADDFEIID